MADLRIFYGAPVRLIVFRSQSVVLAVVTLWTTLLCLQAHAALKKPLPAVPPSALTLAFSETFAKKLSLHNAPLSVEVEFEIPHLKQRLGQLNARNMRAQQIANSISAIDNQHIRLPDLRETMRLTRAKIDELEKEMARMQKSPNLSRQWLLTPKELQSGTVIVDLTDNLMQFKDDLRAQVEVHLSVRLSESPEHEGVQWSANLSQLLLQLKTSPLIHLQVTPDLEVIAYRRDQQPALQLCEPCRYR